MKYILLTALLAFTLLACQDQAADSKTADTKDTATANAQSVAFQFKNDPASLSKYWYQGKAELNHYELQQNRYQATHPGEAVLIFVTEDFLTDKQVKNDNYTNPNSTGVLKTNAIRKFPTGLYDYSIMSSVFTPTDVQQYPQTLKVTTTAQDWCGHAFMQLNYREQQYQMQLNSYFENEGDQEKNISYAILEDELFNRIRMNPEGLPTGKVDIIPSTVILRLKHLPFRAVQTEASLTDYEGSDFEGENLKAYTVAFPSLDRRLQIVFENEAPYIIEGWTDTYPSAFDRQPRTTVAKRTKTLLSPYWNKNSPADQAMRKELDLKTFAK
jgi:hypothetical protein